MKMMKLVSHVPIPNMISWSLSCFHLLKNNNNKNIIKLIHSDGRVTIYHRPIKVSDLILQFPKHLICKSDSFYIGRKIHPLSDHRHLKLGHNYFLLPTHFFHSVLSFLTFASFFSSAAAASAAASRRPFDIQRTPSGSLRLRLSDDFISGLIEQSNPRFVNQQKQSKICTTPQLAKDYTQLATRRQWKPNLDTIRECRNKRSIQFVYKPKIRLRFRAH